MALGVEQAVAEILRDGDPARQIAGFESRFGWELYDSSNEDARRIYVGEEPDDPDALVVVILEGGLPPIGGSPPNELNRQPAFTVRSRDLSYELALERAYAAYRILSYYEGVANDVPFWRVLAQSEPFPWAAIAKTAAAGGSRLRPSRASRSATSSTRRRDP